MVRCPLEVIKGNTVHTSHLKFANSLALYPGSTQLSVASSAVKRERAWYFSHMSDVRIKGMVERV